MHVQCSYVHNFIKHIFKVDPYHHPHCSNTNNNFYGTRPDYLVDVQGCAKTLNNVFGECKGKGASVDSCNRDKYRLAVFSQVAMQEQKLKSFLTFFSKDNEITFYIMKKMNGLFFFCKIAQIKIPTTEADFKSLGVYFNDIAMIRQAYTSNCHQREADEQQFETLPWSMFSEMACKR
ncbi:hypothetical protein BD560DRAFT_242542 [Blakeslea trispora]|nr:hypothetical protein BD560DRAFT_242542 [Blakeslea trispora]